MTRRIAVALLNLASRILPTPRREWARDMRGELQAVKSDRAALRWALGCVLASVQQRVLAMLSLDGRISRPVLMLEWLMCFLPLTLLWASAIAIIITQEDPTLALSIAALFGTLGPIALLVSLTATAAKRRINTRRIARLLLAGFTVMGVLQIINAGAQDITFQWLRFDLGTFVLLSLLPIIGALHFDRLARAEVESA